MSKRIVALACARTFSAKGAEYTGALPLPASLASHPALTAKPTETYPNPADMGGWHYVIDAPDESWIAFVDTVGKALLWTHRDADGGVIGAPFIFQRKDLAIGAPDPYVVTEEFAYDPDQSRADDGKFGEGAGGGGHLPKGDHHVDKVPKGASHDQLKWAHEKAKGGGRPVFVTPNGAPGQQPHKLAYKAPKSGDYHAVHPDGSITHHSIPKKGKAAHSVHGVAATARGIETVEPGKAPHAVRLWRAGLNATDKGDLVFSPRSAALVMGAYQRRDMPLVFDYEHESMLPLEKRGGAPMKGAASAPQSTLEVRNDASGAPECWATGIEWTPEAIRQIETGERRQISPVSNFDLKTREVTEIVNVALCREGASHFGTILASVATKGSTVEDIVQQIIAAAQAGDFEKVEALCAQAEQAGDAGTAMMGRAMCTMGKPPAPPPPPKPAQTAPMAASRDMSAGMPEAFTRQIADLTARTERAERNANVGRVEGMIAASRDCFDAADEREHMAAADPETTRRHIASVKRKMGEGGTLAASRTVTEARPPKATKGGAEDTHGLTPIEIHTAMQGGVSLEDFAAAKARHAKPGAVS